MRLHLFALCFLIAVGGGACTHTEPSPTLGQSHALQTSDNRLETTQKSEDPPIPAIPKDASFTVYCTTIQGDNHAARAKSLRSQLVKSTGMTDWYIVQADGHSTLYYGFYRDEKDTRAHEDRKTISNLRLANGDKLFQMVCLMPLEGGGQYSHPQWNLENAQGAYTLQIAVYRDSPQRKDFAFQAVKDARASGIEAYYYHGPTASLVCIGAWPETAVRETTEIKAQDPNEVIGIAPPATDVPENGITPDGRRVRFVKPTYEIIDASLRNAKKQYPTQSINGLESRRLKNPQTGEIRTVTTPSVVVKIPRKSAPPLRARGPDVAPDVAVSDPVPDKSNAPAAKPATPTKPSGAKLKSIDD